jgi:hypothetical protein
MGKACITVKRIGYNKPDTFDDILIECATEKEFEAMCESGLIHNVVANRAGEDCIFIGALFCKDDEEARGRRHSLTDSIRRVEKEENDGII